MIPLVAGVRRLIFRKRQPPSDSGFRIIPTNKRRSNIAAQCLDTFYYMQFVTRTIFVFTPTVSYFFESYTKRLLRITSNKLNGQKYLRVYIYNSIVKYSNT